MTDDPTAARHPVGLLDTCVLIDIERIDETELPASSRISAVTLAELGLGVAMASDAPTRALRSERQLEAEHTFDALPFDSAAARRFTTMTSLIVAAGNSPKPRKVDLMIAAIASVNGLPLFTSNTDDFIGLESVLTLVPVTPVDTPPA
ncbi:type II toxin-antitoxin system VapC family toxin [Tsukamurella sp. NPDC003166]|uniref:type II toxin-antitoxin system VapC family toxin n=1 Tax=Tsukamurella sp. NPDC003166 TaxID=3154444 RepID=UPI0033B26BC9